MTNTYNGPAEGLGVRGGKIWTISNSRVSIKPSFSKNDIKFLVNIAIAALSLIAAIVMTIVGYVQILNTPAQKTDDFFLVFTPFSQGWEWYFLVPILTIFLISLLPLLHTEGHPIGAMLAIMVTAMLILLTLSSSMVAGSVRHGSVEEWLQDTQGLSPVTSGDSYEFFSTDQPFMLQNEKGEKWAVIFNYDDSKLSIVSKTQIVEVEK